MAEPVVMLTNAEKKNKGYDCFKCQKAQCSLNLPLNLQEFCSLISCPPRDESCPLEHWKKPEGTILQSN